MELQKKLQNAPGLAQAAAMNFDLEYQNNQESQSQKIGMSR